MTVYKWYRRTNEGSSVYHTVGALAVQQRATVGSQLQQDYMKKKKKNKTKKKKTTHFRSSAVDEAVSEVSDINDWNNI